MQRRVAAVSVALFCREPSQEVQGLATKNAPEMPNRGLGRVIAIRSAVIYCTWTSASLVLGTAGSEGRGSSTSAPINDADLTPFMRTPPGLFADAPSMLSLGHLDHFVDTGCGNGQVLLEVCKSIPSPPRRIIGIDVCQDLLQTAGTRLQGITDTELYCASFTSPSALS